MANARNHGDMHVSKARQAQKGNNGQRETNVAFM